jgi:putative membrane protein
MSMSYLDDPRVFFAAERTLLAWQRTAIAIIGLGVLVERFGLVLEHSAAGPAERSHMSLAVSVLFLLAGAFVAAISTWQYRRFLRDLSAPEVPRGHLTWPGPALNTLLAAASLGMAMWFVLSA